MKKTQLLLGCIYTFLFQGAFLFAQSLPQTTIPVSQIREMLGVDQGNNFALVYKGDTLASQSIETDISRTQFFDEHITCINFGDSLEFKYSLSNKEGSMRLSLPDSNKLFSREFRFHDSTEHIVRCAKDGSEKYVEFIGKKLKTVTRFSENVRREIKTSHLGWSMHYKQLDFDSSYVAYYAADSVLMSYASELNYPNGESVYIYTKVNPYSYSERRSYYDQDSSYTYNYYIRNGDTSISDNLNHRFKNIDSSYQCNSWNYEPKGFQGFTQSFEGSTLDSSYGYSSAHGCSIGWTLEDDTFKISKSYNLKGDLIARESMLLIDGDYGIEELMERSDTFYHVINYYHNLYWDKDHITDYFPFKRQVYFNKDSLVIRELIYSFEEKDEWPLLTIKEADSTWIVNTADGAKSEYALKVGFCGGPTINMISSEVDEASFQFEGVGRRKVKKTLSESSKEHIRLDFGIGAPPLYFMYVKGTGKALHSFKSHNFKIDQEFTEVLKEANTSKAILYIDQKANEVECTFLRLNYEWSGQSSIILNR